jgi:hypothetical protein
LESLDLDGEIKWKCILWKWLRRRQLDLNDSGLQVTIKTAFQFLKYNSAEKKEIALLLLSTWNDWEISRHDLHFSMSSCCRELLEPAIKSSRKFVGFGINWAVSIF